MNNLISLIRMQYYSVYAIKRTIAAIVIIALILSIFDSEMIVFSSSMIVMSMTYSSAAYEDRSNMNYLVYSLPIQPRLFVLSKYVYGFLNTLIAMAVSNILIVIMKKLNLFGNSQLGMLDINLALIFIGLLITIVVIPMALILGFEKGRLILIILAVVPVCLGKVINMPQINLNISPVIGLVLGLLVLITLTLISYFITANLYEKRDI